MLLWVGPRYIPGWAPAYCLAARACLRIASQSLGESPLTHTHAHARMGLPACFPGCRGLPVWSQTRRACLLPGCMGLSAISGYYRRVQGMQPCTGRTRLLCDVLPAVCCCACHHNTNTSGCAPIIIRWYSCAGAATADAVTYARHLLDCLLTYATHDTYLLMHGRCNDHRPECAAAAAVRGLPVPHPRPPGDHPPGRRDPGRRAGTAEGCLGCVDGKV